jgi:hypothetical protein
MFAQKSGKGPIEMMIPRRMMREGIDLCEKNVLDHIYDARDLNCEFISLIFGVSVLQSLRVLSSL